LRSPQAHSFLPSAVSNGQFAVSEKASYEAIVLHATCCQAITYVVGEPKPKMKYNSGYEMSKLPITAALQLSISPIGKDINLIIGFELCQFCLGKLSFRSFHLILSSMLTSNSE
jgi:hypothetical protein